MTKTSDVRELPERIRQRYESYLKTSFFFKDRHLRDSFQTALQEEGSLLKGPLPEPARGFEYGLSARELARECFPDRSGDLLPALIDGRLYNHFSDRTLVAKGALRRTGARRYTRYWLDLPSFGE